MNFKLSKQFDSTWYIWAIAVIIWNICWPDVPPVADIIIAIILSICLYQYKNRKIYNTRYSLFIGRYQPFHNGHKWLIEERLKLGKKVCIAVMDIHELEPEKNPYPTNQVIQNIADEMKDYLDEGLLEIISIPPIESVNYGRTVGYDIIEHLPPENIKQISATKIRNKQK